MAWSDGESRRAQVNFTLEIFEGQDEIGSGSPAFQREEVELAKPFLIRHVTKTPHWPLELSQIGKQL